MSLQLCDGIAKSIERQLKADFRGLDIATTSDDELSEKRARLYLTVFEWRGDEPRAPCRRHQISYDHTVPVTLASRS